VKCIRYPAWTTASNSSGTLRRSSRSTATRGIGISHWRTRIEKRRPSSATRGSTAASVRLSNSPETFQRAVNVVLGGLKWTGCLVYVDDIIVFSQSAGEHLEHLREVFAALRGAGVSLRAKKCHLLQEEVEYLGPIVGRGQLTEQVRNIHGLKEASPARCRKDLRRFMRMCRVYQRFVKDYAEVAWPLAAMTSSKTPDGWGT